MISTFAGDPYIFVAETCRVLVSCRLSRKPQSSLCNPLVHPISPSWDSPMVFPHHQLEDPLTKRAQFTHALYQHDHGPVDDFGIVGLGLHHGPHACFNAALHRSGPVAELGHRQASMLIGIWVATTQSFFVQKSNFIHVLKTFEQKTTINLLDGLGVGWIWGS